MVQFIVIIILISLAAAAVSFLLPYILILSAVYVTYLVYLNFYFKSKKFLEIKDSIQDNIKECNELNEHIKDLKKSYKNFKPTDYGEATFFDDSIFNFKRPKFKENTKKRNVYHCSATVCKGAQQQPFKYLCKYFNIEPTEKTLEGFEKILNDFSSAEEGKTLLKQELEQIMSSVHIPFFIKKISSKRLKKELGFEPISYDKYYFPSFEFRYTSAGGNSSMKCNITLDINNLNRFIEYLSGVIKFRNSIAGQRALMTSSLRQKIKQRDNYTCKYCGNSTKIEPNLLLEIDHIIPLSKGGITSEDNLQTLCWRCNRSKGAKIIQSNNLNNL